MKQYIINYMIFGNFQSNKIFSFENMPTKEECQIWFWNILNIYEKHTLDWDLLIAVLLGGGAWCIWNIFIK